MLYISIIYPKRECIIWNKRRFPQLRIVKEMIFREKEWKENLSYQKSLISIIEINITFKFQCYSE